MVDFSKSVVRTVATEFLEDQLYERYLKYCLPEATELFTRGTAPYDRFIRNRLKTYWYGYLFKRLILWDAPIHNTVPDFAIIVTEGAEARNRVFKLPQVRHLTLEDSQSLEPGYTYQFRNGAMADAIWLLPDTENTGECVLIVLYVTVAED